MKPVIVLTRERKECQEMIKMFGATNYKFIVCPMIKIIGPKSWKLCDWKIENLANYNGLVFTSKNGASYFLNRVVLKNFFDELRRIDIFSVGEKTATVIKQMQLKCNPLPDRYNAKELAQNIVRNRRKIKKLLIVEGDLARNELPMVLSNSGIEVEEVIVYRNERVLVSSKMQDYLLKELSCRGRIKVIVFFSPSAVKNFFKQLEWVIKVEGISYAVIGKTTESALREIGLRAEIMPIHSTAESMVQAIKRYISG